MKELSSIAEKLQHKHHIRFEIISGGNSANYQWLISSEDVGLVYSLRLGESILIGRDTLTSDQIPGLHSDAFTLVAEVIELKTKPSQPYGLVAQDAFGQVPQFEDKGNIERAILAIGRQDVDFSAIKPRIEAAILGVSSDHLILDASGLDLKVGDEVKFDLAYSALLQAMTSPYVEKLYFQ